MAPRGVRNANRHCRADGPLLPDGVLEDDGADCGIVFVAVAANLERQFEFGQLAAGDGSPAACRAW